MNSTEEAARIAAPLATSPAASNPAASNPAASNPAASSQPCQLTTPSVKGSRLIGKILSPAIQLWLRSQVEAVQELKFQLQGSDREILQGRLLGIKVHATQVIYQGLHLSAADLSASQIQMNLKQVFQGQPLRLLAVVPVTGTVMLKQSDLEASLKSPLLQQALRDFARTLLQHMASQESASVRSSSGLLSLPALSLSAAQLEVRQVNFTADGLLLQTVLSLPNSAQQMLTLQIRLQVMQGSILQFTVLELRSGALSAVPAELLAEPQPKPETVMQAEPFQIDLGAEVHLDQLQIDPNGLVCRGQINVLP